MVSLNNLSYGGFGERMEGPTLYKNKSREGVKSKISFLSLIS